ncbi:anchored repeat ABC transporter, substrate-binding protein [Rothia sp. ZJ1223]|uniref:anchored repeat ABC transporter, substrate-binding protein n=1 Tax=Rothia sp. ZJ1223 TaxID=2811098 RepID=UPI0019598DB2|nr:anchored repeat ABC transporter, substrate-binding protein [Rothia sp. ZJ1223]MBM7052301.1 anchored repeat ABC transporter, substrate-binding protein [Rothia sp. ZJ1223]
MRKTKLLALAASCLFALTACTAPSSGGAGGEQLKVVTTTPILADFAARVGGDYAQVSSLVPNGADPHSYEPTLRDVRDIAYADVAFTNGLLLEQQKMLKTVSANLPQDATSVAVAEGIETYGGKLQPIVEDASLDSVWLGLRVEAGNADTSGEHTATFSASNPQGPGRLAAFITQTFGAVEVVADSEQGRAQVGSTQLPLNAHTHLSWAFTASGHYTLEVSASSSDPSLGEVPTHTLHFVVGEDPTAVAQQMGTDTHILDGGHADLTAQLDQGRMMIRTDHDGEVHYHELEKTLVVVPSKTLQELPASAQYRFLGRGGEQMYLLAQAVAGKHVHGEIDPHIWHSVPNAKASVELMRDTLATANPKHASAYNANASALLAELDQLNRDLIDAYASLPDSRKNLITTHDGYRYLASTYGLETAGFVTPAPGSEPSIQQRNRLRRTIEDLNISALYINRGEMEKTSILAQVAEDSGVRLCQLYADSLDSNAPHYIDMMRSNAQTITECSGN